MAARPNHQTAILDRGIPQRKPDREHVGLVGLGQNHAVVLVHWRLTELHPAFGILGRQMFWRLQTHMLHGVGIDLRPDDRLDRIEQLLIAHRVEDRRADPERRICLHVGLRQREIKILGMHRAALLINFDQPLAKR